MLGREIKGFSLESGMVVLYWGLILPLREHWTMARDFLVVSGMIWQGMLLASGPGVLLNILPVYRTTSPPKNQRSGLVSIVLGSGLRNLGVGAQGRDLGGRDMGTQT